tara:strand:- start:476 stop:1075 length:600 start_codon:yes stop_codon:yes gene_type:complete
MIVYREAVDTEAKEIAEVHYKTFKNFFLTSLGNSFLKTYYKSCIKFDEAIAICAVDENNNIVGFSVGSLNSKGFHKRLIFNNCIPFFIQTIIILVSKPKALFRLFKNFNKEVNLTDDGNYAELLSIGVLIEKKGLGIGKGLLVAFEKIVQSKNIKRISLTTDFKNNDSVLKFYKSLGYEVYYDFIAYPKRKMFRLIKKI